MKHNILLVLLVVLVPFGCSTDDLPSIENPDRLVKDCDALLIGSPNSKIDPAQWPASIHSLNPTLVEREENYIIITTFAQTGIGTRGYMISRQNNFQVAHYKITPSQYPNIYRFEFVP